MKRILLVCLFSMPFMAAIAQFSKADLQKDFSYAEKALREIHPGLFRYQTKQQFDSTLAASYAQIKDNMSRRDFYKVMSGFISSIRCAHTVIIPKSNWADTLRTARFYFPFQIFFIGGEPILIINRSRNEEVSPGAVLLKIDGRPVREIVDEIFGHLFADGFNETLKYRQIHNLLFSYYYNAFISQADSFHIEYRNQEGQVKQVTLPSVSVAEAEKNMRANPVNKQIMEGISKESKVQFKDRDFRINKRKGIATIQLRAFFGGKTGKEADQKLGEFMNECITKTNKQHIRHLVIDLRNNAGGYDSQGQELLSWLIQQPVQYYKSMHTITNNSPFLEKSSISKEELKELATRKLLIPQPDSTFLVTEQANPTLAILQPKPNAYKGNIYFITNGATGSTTAEFTAVAHHLKVGTFIGEETGGNYTGGNGAEYVGLTLPVTKMHLNIPLVYYRNAVDEPKEKGRGTIPDYEVSYTLQDLLTGVDTQLEFVYRLIEGKK